MNLFVVRFKELRTEKNITKRQLAKDLGVSHTTIGRWEEDKISPTLENIIAICKFFGVTSDYLIGLED